mmetsp:Transcript_29303/g.53180  ORF Transcript_29303/g.53180 Transcript_29303/m.53180 type:complete len:142 (-) Transcript_29303:5194-5619(-)
MPARLASKLALAVGAPVPAAGAALEAALEAPTGAVALAVPKVGAADDDLAAASVGSVPGADLEAGLKEGKSAGSPLALSGAETARGDGIISGDAFDMATLTGDDNDIPNDGILLGDFGEAAPVGRPEMPDGEGIEIPKAGR